MGELYLLDTNMLVHYVRGDKVWHRIQSKYALLVADPQPLISVVSVGELRSLALQFNWQTARRTQMEFILNYFEWINIDREAVLRHYSMIDAYTRKQGRPMGKNDLWIAATARATGARILTTDRDFDFIHSLFIRRDWIDPTTPPISTP
jgi:tRNA(fMet)-specific endonuclease VapC